MKKILFLSVLVLATASLISQNIDFNHGTWAEIKAKAKAEKKLIFVDAFTTWCGPCKMLAKNTFTNADVASYYNSNFINAKIDMEKGEGIDLAKQYQVACYPNLLFVDGDGNLVHRAAGYFESPDFIALGKTAQTPEKTFASVQRQYEAGNTNPTFVAEYLKNLSQSCLSANDAAIKYFKNVKESDMFSASNWRILYDYVEDISSAPFTFFVKNRKEYAAKYGADSVNGKIFNSYLGEGYSKIYAKKGNPEVLASFKKEITQMEFERADELNLSIDLRYFQVKGDWNGYFNSAKALVEKYRGKDPNFINSVSWSIFEHSKEPAQLEAAEQWSKRSVQISPEAAFMDTYANLLYKNGKKQEAIVTQKKAIEQGAANKEDTRDMEETLKKFEGGL